MGYIKLKDLPIGSKISFGKYQVEAETPQSIIWEIVDSNYYVGNYSNPSTITLMTAGIIDFRAVDWQEHIRPDEGTNTSEARAGGYNYYFQSNIDQWLNSDKAGGEWFTAQHTYDTPPSTWVLSVNPNFDYNGLKLFYRNHPGFLYYFNRN